MVSLSQHQIVSACEISTLLRCSTFTVILLQCCVKMSLVSSVIPNALGFFYES